MPKNPVDRFFEWFFELFLVRVFLAFGAKNGYVLAAGLAYQALFALFAALWSGFSVAGIVLSRSPALQDSLFEVIDASVPGLIKTASNGAGAIDPSKLLHAGIFGFTGVVAVVVLVFTAIGFLGSARGSVRTLFDVAPAEEIFLIRKAKDLLLGLLFGIAVLLSSVLSLISTSSVRFLLGLLDIDATTFAATILLRGVGLILVFAFDTVVLMGLYRVLSGLLIPRKRLISGSLRGAAALGVLKAVGGSLLGHSTTNPLLVSFAVIVGLLIFLNLVCQVLLVSASWIALEMKADGILADPVAERERLARLEAARQEEIRRRAYRAQPRWVRAASVLRAALPRRGDRDGAEAASQAPEGDRKGRRITPPPSR